MATLAGMWRRWTLGLALAAPLALAPPALAGSSPSHTLTVRNETGFAIHLAAWDRNDETFSFPSQEADLSSTGPVTLKCNTNDACQLSITVYATVDNQSVEAKKSYREVQGCQIVRYDNERISLASC